MTDEVDSADKHGTTEKIKVIKWGMQNKQIGTTAKRKRKVWTWNTINRWIMMLVLHTAKKEAIKWKTGVK